MTPKKKIFVISIISTFTLLFILLCILILLKNKNFEKEYSFNISLPPENFYEDNCGCTLEKLLSFRNFKSFELNPNTDKNEIIFSQIQINVRNIIRSNDSKNGIHVKLSKKTKYEDVIRILDICEIEKAPTYVLKDYDIWIMTSSNSEMKKNCPFKFPMH